MESLISWDLRDLNPEPAGYESDASEKATDSNASGKTAHDRHIRSPLIGYLFRAFRAALNASL